MGDNQRVSRGGEEEDSRTRGTSVTMWTEETMA